MNIQLPLSLSLWTHLELVWFYCIQRISVGRTNMGSGWVSGPSFDATSMKQRVYGLFLSLDIWVDRIDPNMDKVLKGAVCYVLPWWNEPTFLFSGVVRSPHHLLRLLSWTPPIPSHHSLRVRRRLEEENANYQATNLQEITYDCMLALAV